MMKKVRLILQKTKNAIILMITAIVKLMKTGRKKVMVVIVMTKTNVKTENGNAQKIKPE